MTDHDFRPAFDRLARTMKWDELDDNTPPPRPQPPAVMPPVARDLASVERTAAWRRALARAVKGRAA